MRLNRNKRGGQSLVEMVLVTPLLLLIFAISGFVGIGMYQANQASEAIRQPAMHKMEMANTVARVDNGRLLGYVQGSQHSGNIRVNQAVDSVTVRANGFQDQAAVVTGTKHFSVGVTWLPEFDFTVAQAVQTKLLEPAEFNATRHGTGPWVPGGTPRMPPWKRFPNLPPGFDLNEACARVPVSPEMIRSLDTDKDARKVYISVPEMPPGLPSSPIKPDALLSMASTMPGSSCGDAAGTCNREFEDFMPDPRNRKPNEEVTMPLAPPAIYIKTMSMKNPPGAPGLKVEFSVQCLEIMDPVCQARDPVYERLPEIGPNHGNYFDPTEKYLEPPEKMKTSCMSRKKAECQLKEALDKANAIAAAFPDGCN